MTICLFSRVGFFSLFLSSFLYYLTCLTEDFEYLHSIAERLEDQVESWKLSKSLLRSGSSPSISASGWDEEDRSILELQRRSASFTMMQSMVRDMHSSSVEASIQLESLSNNTHKLGKETRGFVHILSRLVNLFWGFSSNVDFGFKLEIFFVSFFWIIPFFSWDF